LKGRGGTKKEKGHPPARTKTNAVRFTVETVSRGPEKGEKEKRGNPNDENPNRKIEKG